MQIRTTKFGPCSKHTPALLIFIPCVAGILSCSKLISDHSSSSRSEASSPTTILSYETGGDVKQDEFQATIPAGVYTKDVTLGYRRSKTLSTDGLTSIGESFSIEVKDLSGHTVRDLLKPVEITLSAYLVSLFDKSDIYVEVFDPLTLQLREILRPSSVTFEGGVVEVKVVKTGNLNGIYQIAIVTSSGSIPTSLWKSDAKIKAFRVFQIAKNSAKLSWDPPITGVGNYLLAILQETERTSLGTSVTDESLCVSRGTTYSKVTSISAANLLANTSYYAIICAVQEQDASVTSFASYLVFRTWLDIAVDPLVTPTPTSSTPPSVASLSPNSGSASGGTTITLSGSGFRSGATVQIGSSACASVIVVSSTSISCSTPAGSVGTTIVKVTNPDQQSSTIAGGFTYLSADSWTSITPSTTTRSDSTAVWTGSQMIVWGGNIAGASNTGEIFDPVANSWSSVSTANAPVARNYHVAVWTGSKMIVWGGTNGSNVQLDTGGIYDPGTNTWTATSTGTVAPREFVEVIASAWTGSKMIIWGRQSGTTTMNGGSYDPSTNTWTTLPTSNAPAFRGSYQAVWAASKLIVWGGYDGLANLELTSGAFYDPGTDSWTATSTNNVPTGRHLFKAVSIGDKMMIWGGVANGTQLYSGAIYDPTNQTWTDTATNSLVTYGEYSMVWTGSEVIIWGGKINAVPPRTDIGSRYNPTTDTWSDTSLSGAPSIRSLHTAIWTGSQMIIWGGDASPFTNTGALYTP